MTPLGHEDVAAFAAHELGRRLLVVKAEELPPVGPDLDQFALAVGARIAAAARRAAGAGRYRADVAGRQSLVGTAAGPRLPGQARGGPAGPAFVRLDVNKPGPVEQKRLWRTRAGRRRRERSTARSTTCPSSSG